MSSLFKSMLSALNSANKMIDKLDKQTDMLFDDVDFNPIINKGKNLFNNVGGFIKEVKDTLTDLKVEVPYDKENDTLGFTTEGGVLTVEVKSKDGKRQNAVSTTIPENAEVDKMTRSYDDEKKLLTFSIPKKKDINAIKSEKVQELLNAYTEKKEALKKQFLADVEKVKKDLDETKSEKSIAEPTPANDSAEEPADLTPFKSKSKVKGKAKSSKKKKPTVTVVNGKAEIKK